MDIALPLSLAKLSTLLFGMYCFWGIGLTLLTVPEQLTKFTLILSPFVGYSLLTFVGWLLYQAGTDGTTSYCRIVLLVPTILIVVSVALRIQDDLRSLINHEVLCAFLVATLCYIALSVLSFRDVEQLTSVSAGNNDVAEYALVSRALTQHSLNYISSTFGNYRIHESLQGSAFGAFLSTAYPAALFRVPWYQLQTVSINLFFALCAAAVFVAARCGFNYTIGGAIVAAIALLGLQPLLVAVFSGFQAQFIATGMCVLYFSLCASIESHGATGQTFRAALPLSVILVWGMSITYPHIIPLIFFLAGGVAVAWLLASRHYSALWRWACFLGATLVVVALMSPKRMVSVWTYSLSMARSDAGWFIPVDWPLTTALIGGILAGIVSVRHDHRLRNQIVFLSVVSATGYLFLAYLGRRGDGIWGAYKAFKYLTYTLPFFLLSALVFTGPERAVSQSRRLVAQGSRLLVLAASGYIFGAFASDLRLLYVTPDMTDLARIESLPDIESVNIRGAGFWDGLWALHFLLDKPRYQERPNIYAAEPQNGKWDLFKCGGLIGSVPGETMALNTSYALVKAGRSVVPARDAELSILGKLRVEPLEQEVRAATGQHLRVPTRVINTGNVPFPAQRLVPLCAGRITLSYHLYNQLGEGILWDGVRSAIDRDLPANGVALIAMYLTAPRVSGRYIVVPDLVEEGVAWLSQLEAPKHELSRFNLVVE